MVPCSLRSLLVLSIFTTTLIALPTAPAHADSMGERRENSDYYVGITPFGFHYPTLYSAPLSAGAYLGRAWMVGIEYGIMNPHAGVEGSKDNGSFLGFELPCYLSETDGATYTNWGVFARYFPNNTFFLGGGLHRRTWSGKAIVEYAGNCTGGNHDATGKFEAQAVVASFMLGNSWQFPRGFTLTGTWLVVSPIVSSSSSFSLDGGQGLSASEAQKARKEGKRLGETLNDRSGGIGVALLTLGWSF